jgi:hypothetical protein
MFCFFAQVTFAFAQAPVANDESTMAEDDWGEEDDGVGFDEVDLTPKQNIETRDYHASGIYRINTGLWTERPTKDSLARARQAFDLTVEKKTRSYRLVLAGHVEYDAAYLYQNDAFDQPTLNAYEFLAHFREAYGQWSLGNWDITLGRQKIVWGEGMAVSHLEVVSPRDIREPGLADLEDLRLPTTASRLGYFRGMHRFEAVIVHEPFFGYRTPPMGPYSPMPEVLADLQMPLPMGGSVSALEALGQTQLGYSRRPKKWAYNKQQFLGRWLYNGEGLDFGLYAASILDRDGIFSLNDLNADTLVVKVPLKHLRYELVGVSAASAYGSWLFKSEVVGTLNKAYNTMVQSAEGPLIEMQRENAFNLMLGVGYSGINQTTIDLEYGQSWLQKNIDNIVYPVDIPALALRISRTFFREDLRVNLALSALGFELEQGWLGRFDLSYTLDDGIKVGLGYITYQPGTKERSPFEGLSTHDQAYGTFRWDFNL